MILNQKADRRWYLTTANVHRSDTGSMARKETWEEGKGRRVGMCGMKGEEGERKDCEPKIFAALYRPIANLDFKTWRGDPSHPRMAFRSQLRDRKLSV